MHIVHVQVRVKSEMIDNFRAATIENARNSMLELGVARFDVIQQRDDPACFVLIEIYRTPDDQLKHRETVHYLAWRDTVAPMMAEPRRATLFNAIFPADAEGA